MNQTRGRSRLDLLQPRTAMRAMRKSRATSSEKSWPVWMDTNFKCRSVSQAPFTTLTTEYIKEHFSDVRVSADAESDLIIGIRYDSVTNTWIEYTDFPDNFISAFLEWASNLGPAAQLLAFLQRAIVMSANDEQLKTKKVLPLFGSIDLEEAIKYNVEVGINVYQFLSVTRRYDEAPFAVSSKYYTTADIKETIQDVVAAHVDRGVNVTSNRLFYVDSYGVKNFYPDPKVEGGLAVAPYSAVFYDPYSPRTIQCNNDVIPKSSGQKHAFLTRSLQRSYSLECQGPTTTAQRNSVISQLTQFIHNTVNAVAGEWGGRVYTKSGPIRERLANRWTVTEFTDFIAGKLSLDELVPTVNVQHINKSFIPRPIVSAEELQSLTSGVTIYNPTSMGFISSTSLDPNSADVIVGSAGATMKYEAYIVPAVTVSFSKAKALDVITAALCGDSNKVVSIDDVVLSKNSKLDITNLLAGKSAPISEDSCAQLKYAIQMKSVITDLIEGLTDDSLSLSLALKYHVYASHYGSTGGRVVFELFPILHVGDFSIHACDASSQLPRVGREIKTTTGNFVSLEIGRQATSDGHRTIDFILPQDSLDLSDYENITSVRATHYKSIDNLSDDELLAELAHLGDVRQQAEAVVHDEAIIGAKLSVGCSIAEISLSDFPLWTAWSFGDLIEHLNYSDFENCYRIKLNRKDVDNLSPDDLSRKVAVQIYDAAKSLKIISGKCPKQPVTIPSDGEICWWHYFTDDQLIYLRSTDSRKRISKYLARSAYSPTLTVEAAASTMNFEPSYELTELNTVGSILINEGWNLLMYNAPIPHWIELDDAQISKLNDIHGHHDLYKDNMTERECALEAVAYSNRLTGMLHALTDFFRSRGKLNSLLPNGFKASDIMDGISVSELYLNGLATIDRWQGELNAPLQYVRDQLTVVGNSLSEVNQMLAVPEGEQLSLKALATSVAEYEKREDKLTEDEFSRYDKLAGAYDALCDAYAAIEGNDLSKSVTKSAVLTFLQSGIPDGMSTTDAVESLKESVSSRLSQFAAPTNTSDSSADIGEVLLAPKYYVDDSFVSCVSNYIRAGMGQEEEFESIENAVARVSSRMSFTGPKLLVDMARQDLAVISEYAASNGEVNAKLTKFMHSADFTDDEAISTELELNTLNLNLYTGVSPATIMLNKACSMATAVASKAGQVVCGVVMFVAKAWKAVANKLDKFLNYISMRDGQSFAYSAKGVMPVLDTCLYSGIISGDEAVSILEWAYHKDSDNGNVAVIPLTPNARVVIMPHPYVSHCYAYGIYLGPKDTSAGGESGLIENDAEFITGMWESFRDLINYINSVGTSIGVINAEIFINNEVKEKFQNFTADLIEDYKTSPDRLLNNSVAATATCAAIGAGIGSFFGPLGTFVGGLVGGVVGLAGSVAVNALTPVDVSSESFQRYANAQITNQDLSKGASVIISSIGAVGHQMFAKVIGAMIGCGLYSCFSHESVNPGLIRQTVIMTSSVPSCCYHIYTDAEVEKQATQRAIALGMTVLLLVSTPLIIKGGKALLGTAFKAVNNFISKRRQSKRITNSVVAALSNGTATQEDVNSALSLEEAVALQDVLTTGNFGEAIINAAANPQIQTALKYAGKAVTDAYNHLTSLTVRVNSLPSV